jgi:two-component system, cell cycle response regulator DivK
MALILVVDDRAENRDLLSYLLSYFGHDVSTASDGAEAVRTALAEPPDLIVMDIEMPGTDGYTAARLMRAETALRDVPLIAVSAARTTTLVAAQQAGFADFYPIPIEPRDFVARLESLLRRRGPALDGTGGQP